MSEIAVIFGIVGVAFCLLYLAMQLEKPHFLLQLLLLFFSFMLFQNAGAFAVKISDGLAYAATAATFYKITTWMVWMFSIYVFIYISYEALKFFGVIKKEAEE